MLSSLQWLEHLMNVQEMTSKQKKKVCLNNMLQGQTSIHVTFF